MRKLTVDELAKAQRFKVSSPAGVYPEKAWEGISAATRERLRKAAERFGFIGTGRVFYQPRPVIRLRMLVKGGAHAGYARLNDDNTIHSYAWFEEN